MAKATQGKIQVDMDDVSLYGPTGVSAEVWIKALARYAPRGTDEVVTSCFVATGTTGGVDGSLKTGEGQVTARLNKLPAALKSTRKLKS